MGEGLKDDVEPAVAGTSNNHPAPLDHISNILQRYLHLTGAQFVALTLWIAHTFKYREFSITPRLALVSPVRGCGKTTVLSIANELAFKGTKIDNTTPAVLFRLIDRQHACILLDEVENQDLPVNAAMRAVMNSGHRSDGKITRYLDGSPTSFSTFSPLALAAIGKLPFPILHRSVVLHMERAPSTAKPLTRFDRKTLPAQTRMCTAVYEATFEWARQCQLNLDPEMPPELRNRAADNWRVLLAIADSHSAEWAQAAREAAVELSGGQDEDAGVRLLGDIREVFDRLRADRLTSAALVAELIEMPEGLWSEWRGPLDNQVPHKLSPGSLALMLAPFRIRPRTIWPLRRGAGDESAKQFEAAWSSYCHEGGTPSQASNIRHLRGA